MIEKLLKLRLAEWGALLSAPMLYIVSALLFVGKDNALALASGLVAAGLLVLLYVWASGTGAQPATPSNTAATPE